MDIFGVDNNSVYPTKDKHDEVHTILGNEVKAITDFSEHDIYAPLEEYVEEYVEDFGISLGFKNLDDFAKAIDYLKGRKQDVDFPTDSGDYRNR